MNEAVNQQMVKNIIQGLRPHTPSSAPVIPPAQNPSPDRKEEVLEMGADFSFEGFQVVRREFFAHLREPAITFNRYHFAANSACINRFPDTDYVQVLVNRETQLLALRPCEENARDSFAWSSIQKGKRKPKSITCRMFFAMVFSMMGWNMDHRYKVLGKVVHANDDYLIVFDLTCTEVYERIIKDGAKPKASRTPVYPASWQNQFGIPFNEHQKSLQIDTFDGYTVYSIKDQAASGESAASGKTSATKYVQM